MPRGESSSAGAAKAPEADTLWIICRVGVTLYAHTSPAEFPHAPGLGPPGGHIPASPLPSSALGRTTPRVSRDCPSLFTCDRSLAGPNPRPRRNIPVNSR